MKKHGLVITFVFLLAVATFTCHGALMAQTSENSLDEQLKALLQHDYFRMNILVQSTFRYSFDDDSFQGGRTFQVPNARVSLRGDLDGGFYYRVFYNMASEPNLLDAFIGYRHSDAFRLTAGAHKPTQTTDFIPAPQNTDFLGRARITGLLVQSREIGISAQGDLGNFYYYGGLFNGTRLTGSNNNNKFYGIGRLQYAFTNIIPGFIRIAISGSHGDSPGIRSGSNGPLLRGERTIFGADIHAETDLWKFKAEYLTGDLETTQFLNNEETISGYYFSGAYKHSPKFWLVGRYQTWQFKLADEVHQQITLGAKFYTTDTISFRVNADFYFARDGDAMQGLSAMMQFYF